MSRKLSAPCHGFVNVLARPTEDGAEVLLQVGTFKLFLTPARARRIADLLHDAADEVETTNQEADR